MNHFDKLVVGMAEAMIKAQDCLHSGNWRFPCNQCNAAETELSTALRAMINHEGARRHIVAGHDERDGNKRVKK
jgi:hypothetical protein